MRKAAKPTPVQHVRIRDIVEDLMRMASQEYEKTERWKFLHKDQVRAEKAIASLRRWLKKQGLHEIQGEITVIDRRLKRLAEVENHIQTLYRIIANASFLLMDWDGYYDPKSKRANPEGLARIVEDAFCLLQGRSWRSQSERERNPIEPSAHQATKRKPSCSPKRSSRSRRR
jgi:hypothetical protein